jgi:D-alanyl-D-alanine carboxypeptidase/D-alanyl-D-alanine-endopeptidase (penicillin-binding protein 4)
VAALAAVLVPPNVGAADVASQADGGAIGAVGGVGAVDPVAPIGSAASTDVESGDSDDHPTILGPSSPALPDADDQLGRVAWLKMRLATILASHVELASARIGVSIVDVDTGETLFEKDAAGRFNLASSAKVMTSSAALARLGTGFRWRTSAYAEKWDPTTGTIEGDLYLRGRGDPTLKRADLRQIAHDLYLFGVRRISGQIVFDLSYFDGVDEPPHFADQPKERAGFRAPIGALSVEGNSIVVVVSPDPGGILPAEVTIEPPLDDYVQIMLADVTTITTGRNRVRVETTINKDKKTIELEVTGQIRADGGPQWIRRRIDDPVRFAGEVMARQLNAEGIALGKKKATRGTVPVRARWMAEHESETLGEIVHDMNKVSNNYIAETLLKTLGAETAAHEPPARPATWADGIAAVQSFLVGDVGLEPGEFRYENGSGLFGSTDFTPTQLTRVLMWDWRDFRVGPDLVASLPVMGVDGTTRSRLALSSARGRARAKTGTLAAVSTLTGYAAIDSRRPLAFAFLLNDIPDGARPDARAVQDQMVEACVAYLSP